MRFLHYLARPNKNMIDMLTVSVGVSMFYEYGLEGCWKILIVAFVFSWISIKMEEFCGFR